MTAPEGFSYIHDFITVEEQLGLLDNARKLEFAHDSFRGQQLKPSYAQFGYSYVSTGRRLVPASPFPDFLTALIVKVRQHTVSFRQACMTSPGEN